MAKRTAVIDIGSNSARMIVFEKSSHFAFHLLTEVKSRVRIGEGAYKQNGILQEIPMNRAFSALEDFASIIKNLKCNKTFCVATSALRDAPNSKEFINKVKQKLNIHIRVIDGQKEAYYGALSAINLLYPVDNATTVDIGGGSTELAKIRDGKVIDTISINIGTVRLKELFFDKNNPLSASMNEYISTELSKIPSHFCSDTIIGIGGTIRSISTTIMNKIGYPLDTVHAFKYEIKNYENLIEQIASSEILDLKELGVKKDRYDTIREGSSIFSSLIKYLGAKNLITNSAGVREGLYLQDLLRANNAKFPHNFKISLKSLSDRFIDNEKDCIHVSKTALSLFDSLSYIHQIDVKYKKELEVAAKLYSVGRKLSFYQESLHSFYFIINNLNYGFSHEEKVLIALLIKYNTNKLPSFKDIEAYKILLPKIEVINWLSFIITLAKSLNTNVNCEKMSFSYENHTLTIKSKSNLYLAKESIKKLVKPASFAIVIETV